LIDLLCGCVTLAFTRIARNRHRWFGRHGSCDIGGARYADRVIE
jgi:predicted DCC family thiol-disulfide oxidoreductase YuxK